MGCAQQNCLISSLLGCLASNGRQAPSEVSYFRRFCHTRFHHYEHCQPILRWLVRVGHQNNPMSNPSYSQNQYTYSPMVSLGTQRHNSMDHQRLCLALFQPLFEMCQLQYVSHVCASELAFSQTFFQRVFTCFSPRH